MPYDILKSVDFMEAAIAGAGATVGTMVATQQGLGGLAELAIIGGVQVGTLYAVKKLRPGAYQSGFHLADALWAATLTTILYSVGAGYVGQFLPPIIPASFVAGLSADFVAQNVDDPIFYQLLAAIN